MANNCKQCVNTHYQPHCHTTAKSLWLCSSVDCGPPHQSRRIWLTAEATNQKRSRHSGRMRNPQFYVSGKRPISIVSSRPICHFEEPRIYCPACRTTLIATRFRVAVICPIIQVPHCIRVFFYFVWFVFINHIFQFYYELCTYCNILYIYLS